MIRCQRSTLAVVYRLDYHGASVTLRLDAQGEGWSWTWATPGTRGIVARSGQARDEDSARRAAFASLRATIGAQSTA